MNNRSNAPRSSVLEEVDTHGTQTGRWPARIGRGTHTVHPIRYMLAVGSLSQGFQFYGIFTDDKYAARWAYNNLKRGTEHRIYPIFDVKNDS